MRARRCLAGDEKAIAVVITLDKASSGSASVTVFNIFGAGGVEGDGLAGAEGLGVALKQAVGARLTVTVVVAVASPQPTPPKVARTQ